jgi:hypothetical protein
MRAWLALVLAIPACGLEVDFSSKEWKEKPIQKVVRLLNEMQAQIEKEGAEDDAMMEQMGCWCETNEREKTTALELAEQRITDLTSAIPEYAAKAMEAEVTIKQLQKEVAENTEALAKATEVRAKEQAEFRTTEKDMIQSAASLKNAVQMMSKVNSAAFTQESLLQVRNIIRHHMEKYSDIVSETLTGPQHRLAMSLIQDNAMVQRQSHRGPSSAIFGILKGMKESFEQNLEKNAEEEKDAVAKFKALKSAKTEEIKAGEDLVMVKRVEMADAKEKNAKSKVDLEDTNEGKKADTEFLQNMKLKCDSAANEHDKRVKVRNEELKAVSQTISILTGDDAKDLFAKSMSFVQISLSGRSRAKSRDRAANQMRRVALKVRDPRLMAISQSMRLDAFAKVKENIDKTVEALKAEQVEERKQKDDCVMSFQENEKNQAEKSELLDDLKHQIGDLATSIGELSEAIGTLNGEIADAQVEMKRASENREKENHEFQTTVTEQRATQAILKKALDKLKSFYAAAALNQEEVDAPSFLQYSKNAGGSGVVMMIETIIDESAAVEAEAVKAENEAQVAYESFMKDSFAANEAASKDVINKSDELAKAEAAKVAAEDDSKHTTDDLLTLGELGQTLHKKCDFLVKNFELRQTARAEEIEALVSAKAIFGGF